MNHSTSRHEPVPLRDAIRHEVERESLSSAQLENLMSLQQAVLTDEAPARSRSRQLATACLVAVLGVFLLWTNTPGERTDYSQSIAMEVVENHLKLKPLDVSAQSMTEVRQFFTQLDFMPITSKLAGSRFGLDERAMLGGRYCSIKGVSAAQLRYQGSGDGLSTLYEVAYDPGTFGPVPRLDKGESPRQLDIKGLTVSLWVEKGLLMVLVENN